MTSAGFVQQPLQRRGPRFRIISPMWAWGPHPWCPKEWTAGPVFPVVVESGAVARPASTPTRRATVNAAEAIAVLALRVPFPTSSVPASTLISPSLRPSASSVRPAATVASTLGVHSRVGIGVSPIERDLSPIPEGARPRPGSRARARSVSGSPASHRSVRGWLRRSSRSQRGRPRPRDSCDLPRPVQRPAVRWG